MKSTVNNTQTEYGHIKQGLLKYSVVFIMALQCFLFSCKKDSVADSPQTYNSNITALTLSDISDDDIFRGIIFLRGPAADLLGDYQALSINSLIQDIDDYNDVKAFQEEILNRLKTDYPDLMADFRYGVTSGSYSTVETTLADAAAKMHEVVVDLTGTTHQQFNAVASSIISTYGLNQQSTQKDFIDAITAELGQGVLMPVQITSTATNIVVQYVTYVLVPDAVGIDSYLKEGFITTIASSFTE